MIIKCFCNIGLPLSSSNMYSLGLFVLMAGTVATAPQFAYSPQPAPREYVRPVVIVRQSQDNNFDGTFNYAFEADNGITNEASGYVKAISPKEQIQVVQGQYSYIAPDGTPIVTKWYADETGFHAEGAHLPVAPEVPEAIAKSLAYQASLPPAQEPLAPTYYKTR